ncbi:hypothetical protein BC940DRAFT_279565 [Gongronella butleri]|nr:hypothetical protein BC940DRAFT_279565 [Gongronella butleri]
MSMEFSGNLTRIYVDGVAHCDWRLTIYGCAEQQASYIINMLNIGVSGAAILIGICILVHRIGFNGQQLFDFGIHKNCFRPRPLDSMLLFLTIFNILRLINSVVLVTNVAPDNWIARSFLFEIGWQFGYGSFALYLIGIAQALAESHKALASGWLPSPTTVDIIGLTFFFAPFITNNVCSLATGILADSNPYLAEVFIHVLYVLWFIHCSALGLTVLMCGIRLVGVLNVYLAKFQRTGSRWAPLKTGIFKIKAVVSIIFICLISFATFLLLYGILRNIIIVNTVGSMVLSAIWNLLGAFTTLAVEAAIIFNPNSNAKGPTFFGLKLASSDKAETGTNVITSGNGNVIGNYDTQFSTYTNNQDNSYTGTLSHNAFSQLKHHGQFDDGPDDYAYETQAAAYEPSTILTSNVGIPLDDVAYAGKTSKVGLVQATA